MANCDPALDEFIIQLTDDRSSYRNGQILSGIVIISPKAQWRAKQIWIEMVGVGHSKIRALQAFRKRKTASLARMGSITGFLEETEFYIKQKKVLWGKEACGDCPCCLNLSFNSEQLTAFPLRRHQFPFSFMIVSDQLPSSFEGNHCYIRYSLKASIEKLNGTDYFTDTNFTLLENNNIDQSNYKIPPPVFEKETYFRCYNCRSGPLRLFAYIDRSEYCPGDRINLEVTVENSTDITAEKLQASVVQCITIKAQNGYQKERRTCSCMQDNEPTRPGGVKRWKNKSIVIPTLTPTIHNSKVLKLDYMLEVAVIARNKKTIKATFPLVIGTAPVNETGKQESISSHPVASPIPWLQQDASNKSKINNTTCHNYNRIQLFLDNRSQPLISIESSV